MKRKGFPCPKCDEKMIIRTSEFVSSSFKRGIYLCTNLSCGKEFHFDTVLSEKKEVRVGA